MSDPIPPSALFGFSVRCPPAGDIEIDGVLDDWPANSLLPDLFDLQDRARPAEVRIAWSPEGLWFALRVEDRKSRPKSSDTKGDQIELYIDTRDVRTVHRPGRHCHRFRIMPRGPRRPAKIAQYAIPRPTASPPDADLGVVTLASVAEKSFYTVEGHLPASVLNGYDTEVTRRMGIAYHLTDTEHGDFTWPHDPTLPTVLNPSFWAVLELVD